jgi:cytohesin
MAAWNVRKEIVELLIDKGAFSDAKDKWGRTPLHIATEGEGHGGRTQYKEVAALLVAKGADVNAKNGFNGRTPLHNAATWGHKEIVVLLIAAGAVVNAKDDDGYTPLDLTSLENNPNASPEIADILRELLFDAASDGDLAGVQAELDKGADVNAKNKDGWTPLNFATDGGHKEVAELLIANGADVNAKDDQGSTPLKFAAYRGQKEIVELLIAAGAVVNAKDGTGRTPLHSAADEGHKKVAELLVANGADVNAKDGVGANPLHLAATKEIVELLIAKGAGVNAKEYDGKTPLDVAITYNPKNVDLLRKHGGKRGVAHVEDRFSSLFKTINQLQHLIIGDDNGGDPDEPSIEKLQGVFVIRGKVGGKYEVQYHTGDNDWQVREAVTLQSNRQLYIDSSSYDEKRFYHIKLVE